MKLRAPAYPLINIDPYFNVWSEADRLTDTDTTHWSRATNKIIGIATVDGKDFRIIGAQDADTVPAMKQVSVDMTAFSTTYVFEDAGVRLKLVFTSALIPSDLYLLTRPVSYLEVSRESIDGKRHEVSVSIAVSEEICMNLRGDDATDVEMLSLDGGISSVKMGTRSQKMLTRSGDYLRIEWGYFYLSVKGQTDVFTRPYTTDDGKTAEETYVAASAPVSREPVLFTFAYDDIKCIEYFHEQLTSYWNKDSQSILDEIVKAHGDYKTTLRRCRAFEDRMFIDAVRAGGEKYAELLELSFRQVLGAHKVAIDKNGEIIYVSKECFSNGCAVTVDVSYPSIPLFLLYNPELVKGMMRPIYRYATGEDWSKKLKYDFAPHDVGQYPLLNGQVYGLDKVTKEMKYDMQMPVEECGNMLIMEATVAIATKDVSFAMSHIDVLEQWVKYLIDNGRDPENQLCTDDFAGHLAHNCNLTLKAIMGIASLGILYGMSGKRALKRKYINMARELAVDWEKRASNGDGSYRLAFDLPNSFSMKYNIVWDKLFGTDVMPKTVIASEVASYYKRLQPYGLPLDNRKNYTKSDWTVWAATLAEDRRDFENLIAPMWDAFNYMPSRVPMTDWYNTDVGTHVTYVSRSDKVEKSFRNRTVQGGLFIKLLEYKGIMKIK